MNNESTPELQAAYERGQKAKGSSWREGYETGQNQSRAALVGEIEPLLELWLLRLHQEPNEWTVKKALDSVLSRLLAGKEGG